LKKKKVGLVQRKNLDFFARVRLINYIRRNAATNKLCDWKELDFDFSDIQLLFPVIEDDQLLQHEFDRLDEASATEERLAVIESAKLDDPPEDLEALAFVLAEKTKE
jgi:hypothetical protein